MARPVGRGAEEQGCDVLGFETDDGEPEEINEEEAQELKQSRDPVLPSKEEVEAHRRTHYPFRNWCKFCVMGRGLGAPHARIAAESKIPIIHVDYFYITEGEVKTREELAYPMDPSGALELEVHRQTGCSRAETTAHWSSMHWVHEAETNRSTRSTCHPQRP